MFDPRRPQPTFQLTCSRKVVRRALANILTMTMLACLLVAPVGAQNMPNDPLLPTDQWGPYTLNLLEAWEYNTGHAIVGILDRGLDTTHEDLRPYAQYDFDGTTCSYSGAWEHGNFRHHRSYDFTPNEEDCDVNEMLTVGSGTRGHGTHVAGIVGATTNNATGVAGTCWNCPLVVAKHPPGIRGNFLLGILGDGFEWLIDQGAQVINASLGFDRPEYDCAAPFPPTNVPPFCSQLARAEARDIVIVASSGNNLTDLEFPALDPRAISAGGIEPDGDFWDQRDDLGGCPGAGLAGCGSNYMATPGTAQQDLVSPAKDVVSTFYPGDDHNPGIGCGDSFMPLQAGYGPCTGTSMSAPMLAGSAGLLRSVNPLLPKQAIRTLLIDHADGGGVNDPELGFGIPDVAASVEGALGTAGGTALPNRLTPMFRLFDPATQRHLLTTVPQVASARVLDESPPFTTSGPDVPGYDDFPGVGCGAKCTARPGASFYLFTGDRDPGLGPLVPLYRLTRGAPAAPDALPQNRATAYAIGSTDIELLLTGTDGYYVDGIEGYLLASCNEDCETAGGVEIHRLYKGGAVDDYVLATESEKDSFTGYGAPPGQSQMIGYAFPNTDTDGDTLIDGFEALAGTDPATTDSDCDGSSDGIEVLSFPYGDPLDSTCVADLAASVFVSLAGVDQYVNTSVNNYGPDQARNTVLKLTFQSVSVFDLIPLGPSTSCLSVKPEPPVTGHRLEFECALGALDSGTGADRSWRITDGFQASIAITAEGMSSVADPLMENNVVQTSISPGQV